MTDLWQRLKQRKLVQSALAYVADSQWLAWLRNDHIFDPLRKEPRFIALMDKLGFKGSTP